MKIGITGASHFVNRMFEACGNFQWAREFLQNSIEAKATRVHFGIEWQAVQNAGVYRRTIIDDGEGMDSDELLKFFSTLGAGAKKIAGIHDNFGVGAKVAAIPWNTYGMVVISYKRGQAAMIWIRLNESTGEYELVDYKTPDGVVNLIEPEDYSDQEGEWCDWGRIRPEWLTDHGTIIVLLGDGPNQDTILGNPHAGENATKGLSRYLNSRFWDLSGITVTVTEPRSDKKQLWPKGPDDRDDSTRPNNREIRGARHWIVSEGRNGNLDASGIVPICGGKVQVEWYLWQGERPPIHSYAQENGYIAVRYKGELFEATNRLNDFRSFGVLEQSVMRNLTLVLEPTLFNKSNGRWGIHADQSRNRLIFTGDGSQGDPIPLADWGAEFAEELPEPIMVAIRAARGQGTGSVNDEEYRRRLMDRFGERWAIQRLVVKEAPKGGEEPARIMNENVVVLRRGTRSSTGQGRKQARKAASRAAVRLPNGEALGEEVECLQDIPRYRFAHADDFEEPFHLAAWAPNDPEGPTVLLNIDSPILQSAIDYHLQRYPDHFAEEIAEAIRHTYGEIAVAKVAHIQKLAQHKNLHELDGAYRSEPALTAALMGLIAEESLIAQRLAKYGSGFKTRKELSDAA